MSKAEKFIQLNTKKYSNETRITIGRNSHCEKQPWLTPEQALRAVEIARKEVIDKACEWINLHIGELSDIYTRSAIRNEFLEDFRKAMEERL